MPSPIAPTKTPEEQASESRKALVTSICDKVRAGRDFWAPVFKQMRKDMAFACGDQWPELINKALDDKYKVNFVQRQINQDVATVYAKNPTVQCEKQQRLEYTVWDGNPKTLAAAQQAVAQAAQMQQQNNGVFQAAQEHLTAAQQAGLPPDPASMQIVQSMSAPQKAQAIVNDFEQGQQRKELLDKIAETAELLAQKILDNQSPEFENQMIDLLVREKTCGVAYVSLKFRRIMESTPATTANASGFVTQFQAIKAKQSELEQDPAYDPDGACAEELKVMVNALNQSMQAGDQNVEEETVVIDFKPATSVIVDPKVRCLTGFVGAEWVAEEFLFSPEQIQAQWKVNIKSTAAKQYVDGEPSTAAVALVVKAGGRRNKSVNQTTGTWGDKASACVWIVQDKAAGMKYVVCDGYDNFLEEPSAPWPKVKNFWTIGALKFRRVEVEENKPVEGVTVYGQSDVSLLRPMQEEKNRSQEALRQHRKANRPRHICGKDTFDKNDRLALSSADQHDVIPLNNVPPGGDCSKVLQPVPTIEITPELYDSSNVMQDALLVTGTQQANLGQQQKGEKATGQAIAEQSRVQAADYDVRAIDKFLSWMVGIIGEMSLQEMQESTVKTLVGQGGVWPQGMEARQMALNHLYLTIEAASTGRPNQAQAVANFNAISPTLIKGIELMGLDPAPVMKYQAKLLDFDKHFDVDEWLATAQPRQDSGKGASESISIKLSDLTSDERAQALQLAGIHATPGAATVKPPTSSTPAAGQPAKPPGGNNLPAQQLNRAAGATT